MEQISSKQGGVEPLQNPPILATGGGSNERGNHHKVKRRNGQGRHVGPGFDWHVGTLRLTPDLRPNRDDAPR